MKLVIRAAGAMKTGPERDLVNDYLQRADQLARGVGFLGVSETIVEIKTLKTKSATTETILRPPMDGILIVLDEKGKAMSSRGISKALAQWRDDGYTQAVFAIGGADGFDKSRIPNSAVKWSLGSQTWPHKLVRVMITEQVYRALSILAGSPYHRD